MSVVRRGWPPAVMLVASMVLGIGAGIGGWQLADQIAASRSEPELIGREPEAGPWGSFAYDDTVDTSIGTAVIDLFNPGGRDIEVVDIQVPGWRLTDDAQFGGHVLPPREWTSLTFELSVDCEANPGSAPVEVTTDRGMTLAVHVGDDLTWRRDDACVSSQQDGIQSERVTVELVDDSAHIAIEMRNPSEHDREYTEVILESRSSGGGAGNLFEVTAAMPITLAAGASVTIDTDWRVADCQLADTFGQFNLQLTSETGIAEFGDYIGLPGHVAAELARLTVAVCG